MWSVQGSVAHTTGERGECTGGARASRGQATLAGSLDRPVSWLRLWHTGHTHGGADTDSSTRTGFRNHFGHPALSYARIAIVHHFLASESGVAKRRTLMGTFMFVVRSNIARGTWHHRSHGTGCWPRPGRPGLALSECGMRGTGQGKTDQKKIDVIIKIMKTFYSIHTAVREYPNSQCR